MLFLNQIYKHYKWGVAILLISLLVHEKSHADQPKYLLKSAYIYNFLKYITWQDEKNIKRWKIAVLVTNNGLSEDEEKLVVELKKASTHQTIKRLPVMVEKINDWEDTSNFHVIFIPNSSQHRLKILAQKTRQTNTLVITENSKERTSFMVNLITNATSNISFEVNKSNIIFEGLTMDTDILLLGGTELDVAQLLRATEDSMLAAQQDKKEQENQLTQLQKKIESQSILLNQQKTQLDTVSSELTINQNKLLEEKNKLLKEKEKVSKIKLYQKNNQQILTKNAIDLKINKEEILVNQQRLKQQQTLIKLKEKEALQLSQEIAIRQKNIDMLAIDLASSDEQISKQLWYLWSFTIAGILFSILLYVIWCLASARKKTNTKLANNIFKLNLAQQQVEKERLSAERANKSKSEFISSMSHELRTPLNAVLGYSQLLQMGDMSNDEIKQSSEEILTAGKHLLDLINDILDLAHIESSKFDVNLKAIDINHVLDNCILLMKNFAEAANVSIEKQKSTLINSCVIADNIRLKQVFINLLSNAIKYNVAQGQVIISTRLINKEYIQIDITDTGVGISEPQLTKLFQPFNRLGVENSNIQGTGIGLVITKKLIKKMNGSIIVSSRLSKGTTFGIKLKLAQSKNINNDDALPLNKDVNILEDKIKILHIEDNVSNQKLIKAMLDKKSHIQLQTVNSAEQALTLMAEQKPDIILLDIDLPGMNGYEFFDLLTPNDEYRNLPVIAITAKAMSTDLAKAQTYNFSSYLTKPILLNDLNTAIYKASHSL